MADAAERALDALGDESRRAILLRLSQGPCSVQEIADGLPISRPAVSRHLRLLGDAGLVGHRSEGTRNVYDLRAEGVEAVADYVRTVWGEAMSRFAIFAENTDER